MMLMKRPFMAGLTVPLLVAVLLAVTRSSSACGLEPMINGGFTVSHPGSIGVAVAVARARSEGFLSPASKEVVSNTTTLHNMLADLRQLKSRLAKGRGATESFSVVLVGPGLWSHFYASSGSILARYHVTGPLSDKTTVLTHHAVIKALLNGDLSIDKATELGLISYSGKSTEATRVAFKNGFTSSNQKT